MKTVRICLSGPNVKVRDNEKVYKELCVSVKSKGIINTSNHSLQSIKSQPNTLTYLVFPTNQSNQPPKCVPPPSSPRSQHSPRPTRLWSPLLMAHSHFTLATVISSLGAATPRDAGNARRIAMPSVAVFRPVSVSCSALEHMDVTITAARAASLARRRGWNIELEFLGMGKGAERGRFVYACG